MTAGNEHIIELLEKYSRKEATSGEVDQLLTLLKSGNYDEAVVSFVQSRLETFELDNEDDIAFWKNRLTGGAQRITGVPEIEGDTPAINESIRPVHRVHFLRRWGWAAASIILLLSIGAYLWTANSKGTRPPQTGVAAAATHIAPGKNGAILTLADGSQVVLDSLGNGVVATQNGTQVLLQGGALAYDPAAASGEVVYNTMTTPKGRQFIVTLSDGTHVWLNAASSLRYPTAFTGNERRVEVTGEAYFEVAHNAKMPFKVNVSDEAAVEVLGTHFNVNAYNNEAALETTLLEGSVKVMTNVKRETANVKPISRTLSPGQQAQIAHGGPQMGIKVINDVDASKIVSWKNGLFNFEGASLGEVMRQLERWYDIEVVYEKGVPDVEFEGKMTKDVPLKDLLVMLERSDVHFRIDSRKLIVLP